MDTIEQDERRQLLKLIRELRGRYNRLQRSVAIHNDRMDRACALACGKQLPEKPCRPECPRNTRITLES